MTDLAPDFFLRLWPGEPLTVTLLEPADLQRAPQRGRVWLASWQWLAHWSSCPGVADDKAAHGGITFAELEDGVRRKSHVRSVSALVIDHDAGTVSVADADRALERYRRIIHTTASHTTEAPRWRALLAVSRPIGADEYALIWRHTATALAASGIPVDPSAKDPCRLWYAPTVRSFGAAWEHVSRDGAVVDVDRVIERAKWSDREIARRAAVGHPLVASVRRQLESNTSCSASKDAPRAGADGETYTAAALRRAAAAVAEASPGTRHYQLSREAFALARLDLSDHEIANALAPAFIRAAGQARAHECERTIRDAIAARRRS